MKRRWFMVTLLVGALALGIMGGTALAQEEGVVGDSPLGKFASRVATILGLDEAVVQDALDQAAEETRDDAIQSKLDRMVENGRLTQEQADDYQEWHMAKPEGPLPGFGYRMFGGRGLHLGGMMGGHGGYGGYGIGDCDQMPPVPGVESSDTTSL